MFEGEKTWVFWVGLIVFAFAFIETFSVIWNVATISAFRGQTLRAMIPFVVGGIVFIVVRFYMMKSGVRKRDSWSPISLKMQKVKMQESMMHGTVEFLALWRIVPAAINSSGGLIWVSRSRLQLVRSVLSRIASGVLIGLLLVVASSCLLIPTVHADQWCPYWPSASQVDLEYRKEWGISYIDVTVTFSDGVYNVSDWGTPSFTDEFVWADATMWVNLDGIYLPGSWADHHSYDLGDLSAGDYVFIFVVWGFQITYLNFTVPPPIPGDLNRDGIVDIHDLTIVAIAYGSLEGEPHYNPDADINVDGIVDMQDLVVVARNLGNADS